MSEISRVEYCIVAVAEAFRGDGEIMASPMAPVPAVGARLAKATFEPELVLTDGVNKVIKDLTPFGDAKAAAAAVVEGWMPFPSVFDVLWWGKRHVMMGASQIDQYGNQNISCIGDFAKPSFQLLGARGAPGNTIHHTTSYWVARHSKKVFVPKVDMVSGVGYDRVRDLPEASRRGHEIRRIITSLGVFDFEGPEQRMRVRSLHPGVTLEEVQDNTDFALVVPAQIPESRAPSEAERQLIASFDPKGFASREVPA